MHSNTYGACAFTKQVQTASPFLQRQFPYIIERMLLDHFDLWKVWPWCAISSLVGSFTIHLLATGWALKAMQEESGEQTICLFVAKFELLTTVFLELLTVCSHIPMEVVYRVGGTVWSLWHSPVLLILAQLLLVKLAKLELARSHKRVWLLRLVHLYSLLLH